MIEKRIVEVMFFDLSAWSSGGRTRLPMIPRTRQPAGGFRQTRLEPVDFMSSIQHNQNIDLIQQWGCRMSFAIGGINVVQCRRVLKIITLWHR